MKKLILIIALFLGVTTQAQTEADKIRNDKAFQEILKKDIALSVTDSHERFQIFYEFQQLVPEGFDSFAFGKDTLGFKKWITSRIDESGFESVEDAVAQYKVLTDATNQSRIKGMELIKEKKKLKEKFDNKELFDKVYREEWEKEMSKYPVEKFD